MKPSLLLFLSLVFGLLVPTARAQERSSETEFKGMELYSWQASNGDWLFALLPGTNRSKSEAEIKEKVNQIAGANELEKHFLRLAEGEQVFWSHRDSKGFAYPDEGTMKAIASSARKAKIELHVPPDPAEGDAKGAALGCLVAGYVERFRALDVMDVLFVRWMVALLLLFKVFGDFFATGLTVAYRTNALGVAERLGQLTAGDDYRRLIPLMDAGGRWLPPLPGGAAAWVGRGGSGR